MVDLEGDFVNVDVWFIEYVYDVQLIGQVMVDLEGDYVNVDVFF